MKAATNRRLRAVHHYLGVFFAPLIVFFAVSGGLQTFRVSEAPGAPAWTVWLASVHKDQTPPRPARPRPAPARMPGGEGHRPPRRNPILLKIIVAALSLALAVSALIGVALALAAPARRRGAVVALVAGTLVPLVALFV